jgi:hypothetical protein
MIKTILFENFSTPSIFTELTGKFPQPDTTLYEWRGHCESWIDGLDNNMLRLCKSIKNDNEHNTAYYAMLSYRYEGPEEAKNDYLNPDGSVMRIPEDMPLLILSHLMRDTIWWLLDLLEDIKPLTPEQQDLWIEKSGNKTWCYEKGKTWCD